MQLNIDVASAIVTLSFAIFAIFFLFFIRGGGGVLRFVIFVVFICSRGGGVTTAYI
jgi:hypothetical protein